MTAEPAHRRLSARVIDTSAGPMEIAQCGEGPAVLLVHGTPGSWRQAAGLALDLADRHSVVLPSRPGYGSTPLSTGRTPAQQAGAYAAMLDALGLDVAAVVGISGGGPSAAQLACLHRDRITALVLCCALAPHLMAPPTAMRVALRIPGVAEVGTWAQRRAQRRRLADATATQRRVEGELTAAERVQLDEDPDLRDAIVNFLLTHLDAPPPVRGLRNDLRSIGFAPAGTAPDLSLVTAPTLVVHGDADQVVPLAHGEFYASAIAGAHLAVLPGAGHAFLITFRAESLDRLREALGS